MEPMIGMIGTIVGVLIGGGITSLNQHFRNQHEQTLARNKRQLEKLEKAHQLLTAISDQYRSYFAYDYSAIFLGIDEKPEEGIIPLPFDELEMLISFYVPELLEDVTGLIKQCQKYGGLSGELRRSNLKNSSENKTLAEKIDLEYTALESKFSELKAKISNHAQVHIS